MSSFREIYTDPRDMMEYLYNSGLLFEINRKVLHPLGFAIGVNVGDDEKILQEGGFCTFLKSDSPEGVVFGSESWGAGRERYRDSKFESLLGEKLSTRKVVYGSSIDPLTGVQLGEVD